MLGSFILIISAFSGIEVLLSFFPESSQGLWLIPFACLKLLEPLTLFLYAKTLTDSSFSVSYKNFLPVLFVGVVFGIGCYWSGGWMGFEFFTNSFYSIILSTLGLLMWAYCLPRSYRLVLKASAEKRITTNYMSLLRFLFLIILISLALEILDDVNDQHHFFKELDFFDVIDLLYLGMVYFISYKALSQPQMFQDVQALLPKVDPPAKYSSSSLSEDRLRVIQEQLQSLIQEEKPYLKGDLTIQDLAKKLTVSRQYLTQVLNEKMKCNFNDYINFFRVEEFKQRAKDPRYENYTILALALDSGFNSKTTFNTIFKKHTGLTPSQYRKGLSLDSNA